MKKNQRKKNKDRQNPAHTGDKSIVINFKEQLKSQDPEVRDAALQLLRQADMVSVIDSKNPRAILVVADKVEDTDDGNLKVIADVKNVRVQVDDEQSDEQTDESDHQIEELRNLVEEAKGPWKYLGNFQDTDKEPRFLFANQGIPWGIEFADVRGLIFAGPGKWPGNMSSGCGSIKASIW